MKKIAIACAGFAICLSAYAEGYQVNTFSPRQEGMGHTGVALKLGAESQIFNPGALGFLDKTMEISAGVSAIKATAKANVVGADYLTSNKVSTPMNASLAFRVFDNLSAGVTFYTPYGSSINWGKSWPAALFSQDVDLKVFTVQPTVAWRPIKNLSIGAGLMISWGSVNLSKGLVSPQSFEQTIALQNDAAQLRYDVAKLQSLMNPAAPAAGERPEPIKNSYGHVSPASVSLQGKSELAVGVNVGVLYDITRQWSVGASFRSKMNMKVTAGDAMVEYADELARSVLGEQLDIINYTNFSASMPCPYVFTFGVSYKPIERLTLAADAQLNGWSAYKTLNIDFDGLEAPYDQHIPKNYKNAWTLHLGGEFAMTKRLDLRAGLMFDMSPCNINYYNPETPGATKWEPSVGLSFRPIKGLSIDLAFMYVYGRKVKNGSVTAPSLLASAYNEGVAEFNAGAAQYNPIVEAYGLPFPTYSTKSPMAGEETLKADYKVHAIIPAIGLSYSF